MSLSSLRLYIRVKKKTTKKVIRKYTLCVLYMLSSQLRLLAASRSNGVHSAPSSTAPGSSCRLSQRLRSWSQSISGLVFLFSCCLFPASFPGSPALSPCAQSRTASVLSCLPAATFQAWFNLGSTTHSSSSWSRVRAGRSPPTPCFRWVSLSRQPPSCPYTVHRDWDARVRVIVALVCSDTSLPFLTVPLLPFRVRVFCPLSCRLCLPMTEPRKPNLGQFQRLHCLC